MLQILKHAIFTKYYLLKFQKTIDKICEEDYTHNNIQNIYELSMIKISFILQI